MIMLHYKLMIFLIIIVIHLGKAEDNRNKFYQQTTPSYDFVKRIIQSKDKIINDASNYTPTQQNIITSTTTSRSLIPSNWYDIEFTLSNVGLRKIGQEFVNSNNCIKLKLDNNEINSISPFALRKMPNLRHLDLSGNKIPKENLLFFVGSTKLQTLLINNNNDNRIVDKLIDYGALDGLKNLYLCNSQLKNLQVPYDQATPNLSHLYLSNNSISSSDVVFNNIPRMLTHLYVDNNLIDRVEPEKLRNLLELIMDNNIITQVCFENCKDTSISLKGAFNMQKLSLSRNKISDVSSDALSDLRSLQYLDLSGNEIVNVHESTFNRTIRITDLSLAHNKLTTIPDICPMRHLHKLNLTENRINTIFFAFCRLDKLEYLYLSNNYITTIESPAFANLIHLRFLDLSGNQLKQLPQKWVLPWNIRELHLERNNFIKLDNVSLIGIDSLEHVYLDDNPMDTFEVESFKSLPVRLTMHIGKVRILDKCIRCQRKEDNEEDYDKEDDNDNDYDNDDDEDDS